MGKKGHRRCFTRKKGYTRRGVSTCVTDVVNVKVEECDGTTDEHVADVVNVKVEECDGTTDSTELHVADVVNVKVEECDGTTDEHVADVVNVNVEECDGTTYLHVADVVNDKVEKCDVNTDLHVADVVNVNVEECDGTTYLHVADVVNVKVEKCDVNTDLHVADVVNAKVEECDGTTDEYVADVVNVKVEECDGTTDLHVADVVNVVKVEEYDVTTDSHVADVVNVVKVEECDGTTYLHEEPAAVISSECEELEVQDSNLCQSGKSSDHSYARYNTDETQQSICLPNRNTCSYKNLKEKCIDISRAGSFSLLSTCEVIRFISVYESDFPMVKVCVTVDKSFNSQIKVHNTDLPRNHEIWSDIPTSCSSTSDIAKALIIVDSYKVCQGNSDSHLVDLVPQGCFLDVARENKRASYKDHSSGVPTIRSTSCQFLVKSGRCAACSVYRRTLSKALFRQKEQVETPKKNLISSRMPISRLSETQRVEKIKQLRHYANSLEKEVEKLNKKLKTCIRKDEQDRNEQHFGLQRASCGPNTNQHVHEFDNTLQKLRTVGGQALAPLGGNTKRMLELNVDNTPFPKRPRN